MADNFLIQQPNGYWAKMRSIDVGGGVQVLQVGGLAELLRPGPVRSGTRVGLPAGTGYLATAAIAANTMYAWPIPVSRAFSASAVEAQVGTLTAGVLGKLGLALPGADGWPSALLAECTNEVDFNSSANTILQATITGSVSVPAGFVWGLFVANGAAQPVTVGPFSTPATFVGNLIGNTSMQGFTGLGSGGATHRLSRAHTYADAFPATLTGWATANANPSSPVLTIVAA